MNQKIHTYKTIALTLISILFTPVFALAHNEIDHGPVAQIHSETSAESDTGGNTGSGTSGNASASSHSTTVIDGSGTGTVEINVRTETNGVVQEETVKKEVQGGVEVRVSTTSTSKSVVKPIRKPSKEAKAEASVEVQAQGLFSRMASTTFWRTIPWFSFGEVGTTIEAEIKEDGRVLTMIERPQKTTSDSGVRGFVAKILNIVIFWR